MPIQKVIITSKNPVKIQASKIAFEKVFPNAKFEFVGVSVPSDVSDQPMSNQETFDGAINRVNNAQKEYPHADFYIGLEAGLEKDSQGELEAFAWMVIKDKTSKIGKARTSTFYLPQKVAELIDQGMELGDADDIVFGGTNSKQKNGAVGILTKDLLTRTSFYAEAVILALIPFVNEGLY